MYHKPAFLLKYGSLVFSIGYISGYITKHLLNKYEYSYDEDENNEIKEDELS